MCGEAIVVKNTWDNRGAGRFSLSGLRAARPSVRARLLKLLVWTWLFGLLVAVVGAYDLARHSAHVAFDRGLQGEVAALAARVTWSDRGPLLDTYRHPLESQAWDRQVGMGYAMVDLDGNTLAGDPFVPVPSAALRRDSVFQPRLFDAEFKRVPVRGAVFSVTSPMLDRTVSVIVVEHLDQQAVFMRRLQLSVVLPALMMGAATLALISWGVSQSFKPLHQVAVEVAARDPHDWRPLATSDVPSEALPLIERINELLSDMAQAITIQRRFVADAAHQLRTPVAGIRLLAQTLATELAAAPPQRGADVDGADHGAGWRPLLEELTRSTERMSRLIGQLLRLVRSETALTRGDEQPLCDVTAQMREAVEPLVVKGMHMGRCVELEADGQPVFYRTDPLWLGEAVVNILDNALRYGGATIRMAVQRQAKGGVRITIDDDGPGMPRDQIERCFDPFWRGERADLRGDDGTGLGLTIAKEIVQRLGGIIWAQTRPEVAGLRVTIELPGHDA